MKCALILLFVAFSFTAQAAEKIPYYGSEFYEDLSKGMKDSELSYEIKKVLRSFHVPTAAGLDNIVDSCSGRGSDCYRHVAYGYRRARQFMMGSYYLEGQSGQYAVREVYCEKSVPESAFPSGKRPGPGEIPDDRVVNAEHTWPQSKFNTKFDKETQKSDLHHLFPSDSQMNSDRGSYHFGKVVQEQRKLKCSTGRLGSSADGDLVFEPPKAHRGNVARALFYFSTRYDLPISAEEEATIREWHKQDPVDAEEMARNEEIFKLQGNRNPFIDFPELVDRISNF